MNDISINDLLEYKKKYLEGKNITEHLRKKKQLKTNSKEVIEIAYELQAGSYVDEFKKNKKIYNNYISEISACLNKNLDSYDSILDIGSGEATILTGVTNNLIFKNHNVTGFDISLSRVEIGKKYSSKNLKRGKKINFFVGAISQIPMQDKSIDIITSSHAIEPNGGDEDSIAKELIRVARKKIILFEPCYEKASSNIKKRMRKLGYIKDLTKYFKKYGAFFKGIVPIKESIDSMNPTYCYYFDLPKKYKKISKFFYTDPGTNYRLINKKNFYKSSKSPLSYPIINKIPILRVDKGIIHKIK